MGGDEGVGGHSFHSRFGDLEIHGPDVCTSMFSLPNEG